MKKLLILFILISINAFGWEVKDGGDYKLCDELAIYDIDSSFVSNPITYFDYDTYSNVSQSNIFAFRNESLTIVKNMIRNTVSYWNEAGSEHLLVGDSSAGSFYIVLRNLHSSYDFDMKFEGYRDDNCVDAGTLTVNASRFQNTGNNKRFFTKLTREFGHMLGLDHTNEYDCVTSSKQSQACTNTGSYKNAVYMSMNTNSNISHLTDDDKYGVRALYGKDDRQIRYVVEEDGSFWAEKFYGNGTTYNTFAQPQIISVPNTTDEFMIVWVKSSTRKINIEFAKMVRVNNMPILQKYLGPYEIQGSPTIGGDYEVLTAPSVAVNNNGTALIVFQRVMENEIIDLQENLYFINVNLTSHSFSSYPILITTSGFVESNNSPLVLWSQKIQKWIVFWAEKSTNELYNWRVKYLISNNTSPYHETHWNFSNIKTLTYQSTDIFAYWNPMTGSCDIKDSQNNEICALYFNRVKPNSIEVSFSAITFKTTLNSYAIDILNMSDDINWSLTNIGHLSAVSEGNNKIVLTYVSNSYPLRCEFSYTYQNSFQTNPIVNCNPLQTANSIIGYSITRKDDYNVCSYIPE